MSYVTILEITHEAIPLWFPVSFLFFGLLATIIHLETRNLDFIAKFIRYPIFFLFACLWVGPAAYYFLNRRHYVEAYRNREYKVVEGPVEQYSWKGKTECFSVRGVEFCHGTANQVGWDPPLRLGHSTWPVGLTGEGLPVRIAYSDDGEFHRILRLDIVRNSP